MEFVAQKGEIIIMNDESCYLFLKTIEYNNEAYLKTIKTGDYLLDEKFESESQDEIYLKEHIEEGECFYDFIKDGSLINELKNF